MKTFRAHFDGWVDRVAVGGQVAIIISEPPEHGGLGLIELRDGRRVFKRVYDYENHYVLVSTDPAEEALVVRRRDIRGVRAWKVTIAP